MTSKRPSIGPGNCVGIPGFSTSRARINGLGGRHVAMQVTRAADYALRAMIELARLPAGTRMSLSVLARQTGAPESFLSKVMQGLCQVGFADSRRGQAGGFAIAAAGRRASVTAIIEAIDGPISLNACLEPGAPCARKADCPGHRAFAKAQAAMMAVLRTETIEALAVPDPGNVQPAAAHALVAVNAVDSSVASSDPSLSNLALKR